ncbi:hypothetical protein HRbin34_00296 [bacterium HR34]|nr:hypothetical protein HRbin34_00296 [bacterium HR34]
MQNNFEKSSAEYKQEESARKEEREKIVNEIVENLKKAQKDEASVEDVILGLSGIGSHESITLRRELLREYKGEYNGLIARSLINVGNAESMELRKELQDKGVGSKEIALSLTGVMTSEAMLWRRKLIQEAVGENNYNLLKNIAESLAGIDTTEARELRELLKSSGLKNEDLILSFTGISNEEAMEFRWKLFNEAVKDNRSFDLLRNIAYSLAGVDNDDSFELREKLLEKISQNYSSYEYDALMSIAMSLTGVKSQKSIDFRKKLLKKFGEREVKQEFLIFSLLTSLAGVDSDESMKLREELYEQFKTTEFESSERFLDSRGFDSYTADEKIKEGLRKEGIKYLLFNFAASFAGVNNSKAEELKKKYFIDNPDIFDIFTKSSFTESISFKATLMAKSYFTDHWPIFDAIVCRYGYEK